MSRTGSRVVLDKGLTNVFVRHCHPTCWPHLLHHLEHSYDAAYFASKLGLETWGVDISPSAVDAAKMVSRW